MAAPIPQLNPTQRADILKRYGRGETVREIADIYGVSQMSIRRAIDPEKYGTKKPGAKDRIAIDHYVLDARNDRRPIARIIDEPDTLLNRLIHEGPSPERRRLMEEGRI